MAWSQTSGQSASFFEHQQKKKCAVLIHAVLAGSVLVCCANRPWLGQFQAKILSACFQYIMRCVVYNIDGATYQASLLWCGKQRHPKCKNSVRLLKHSCLFNSFYTGMWLYYSNSTECKQKWTEREREQVIVVGQK